MTSTRVLLYGLGLLAAFGAGSLVAPRQQPPSVLVHEAPPAPAAETPVPHPAPAVRAATQAPAPLARCDDSGLRKHIETLETALRAQASHKEGARIAFPENAPPQETPEGFKKVVDDVVAKCNPALEVRDLDCSEYPCIAWTRLDGTRRKSFDLSNCEPWTKAYDNPPISWLASSSDADGGTGETYVAFYPFPSDPSIRKPVKARAQERLEAMLEAYGVK